MRYEDTLNAVLLLKDGTTFFGKGFGQESRIVGELVFNTGMVGYTETLTDPSYKGQILSFTYPLIGNYGVPSYDDLDEFSLPRSFESIKIQTSGIAIHELCEMPSHWASERNLHQWMKDEGVPGISGIDTRALTVRLRSHGVIMGVLEVSSKPIDVKSLREELESSKSYGEVNLVKEVTTSTPQTYGSGKQSIVLLDYGAKYGIIRNLVARGYSVVKLPFDSNLDEILSYDPTGVIVSNGPGDPKTCRETFSTIRDLIDMNMPTLGICLGIQVISLALDGDTYKLKYGHRGQNKPCTDTDSERSYVTSQNHGYAVDPSSLEKTDLKPWFVNADDGTIEGVKHKTKKCIAVQFHPEASPGPYDTDFIFDIFANMMR